MTGTCLCQFCQRNHSCWGHRLARMGWCTFIAMWQVQLDMAQTAVQHCFLFSGKALQKPTFKSTITHHFRKVFAFLFSLTKPPCWAAEVVLHMERIKNLSQILEKSIETFTFLKKVLVWTSCVFKSGTLLLFHEFVFLCKAFKKFACALNFSLCL